MISRMLNFAGYRMINLANRLNMQGLGQYLADDPHEQKWITFPNLNEYSVVVDIGGFTGDWASKIYCRYSCRIFICEPHPVFARMAGERFAGNDKIIVTPCAVSSSDGKLILYGNNAAASLYPETDTTVRNTVPVVKASELFKTYPQTIDLLKINAEGAEYEIIPDLIDNYDITRIRGFLIQFHKTGSGYKTKREAIRAMLRRTHVMVWNYDYVFEYWERT